MTFKSSSKPSLAKRQSLKSWKSIKSRKFQFGNKENGVCIAVKESFAEVYSHVWPSSILLSEYLWSNSNIIVDEDVLELGSGCGLPSLLACKMGANSVIATDAVKHADIIRNLKLMAELNGEEVVEKFSTLGLTWGRFTKESIALRPSIIIASDIFFDEMDFEDILSNIQYYFNHGCKDFYSVIQKRGTTRYLGELLVKWRMKCEEIDLENIILNSDYLSLEDAEKLILVKITPLFTGTRDTENHRMESVMGLMKTPMPTHDTIPMSFPDTN